MAESLEQVCRAILSSDNHYRKQAEAILESLLQSQPVALANGLAAQFGNASADLSIRQISVVLMRHFIARKGLWEMVKNETQSSIYQQTLHVIMDTGTPRLIGRKVGDLFSALILRIDQKNEIIFSLISLFSIPSCTSLQRQIILSVFNVLAEFSRVSIEAYLSTIKQMILQTLKLAYDTKDSELSVVTIQCSISVLLSLDSKNMLHFTDITPAMFHSFSCIEDEYVIREAVSSLIPLASAKPHFFRPHISDVVKVLLQMAGSCTYEFSIKRLCAELLCVFLENGKGMVRKIRSFPDHIVSLAFGYLLELDLELDFEDEKCDDDQEAFNLGLEMVERLRNSLGTKKFLPVALSIVQQHLNHSNWINRHATLSFLSKMIDGVYKTLDKNLAGLVTAISRSAAQDPVNRVRNAGLLCIIALIQSFPGDFQEQYAELILPVLGNSILKETSRRIMCNACHCISYFFTTIEISDTISRHCSMLLHGLVRLLSTQDIEIQISALTAVASISDVMGPLFSQYYETFMPGVKSILLNSEGENKSELRGKALECIALMGAAVGKECFVSDAKEILELVVPKLTRKECIDTVEYSFIQQSLARIGQVLKELFIPYLPYIIPSLVHSASLDSGCIIEDLEDDLITHSSHQHENGNAYSMEVAIRGVGEKKITFNTSVLQEKAIACDMLYQFAVDMDGDFFPYVEPVAQCLMPLVRYPFNEQVRIAAVASIPILLKCAYNSRDCNDKFAKDLFNFMLPNILEGIELENDIPSLGSAITVLSETISIYKEPLDQNRIAEINQIIQKILEESMERRVILLKSRENEDFDDVEADNADDELDTESELVGVIVDLVMTLLSNSRDQYVQSFEECLYSPFSSMLRDGRCSDEYASALCVFDDLVDKGGELARKYIPSLVPLVIRLVSHHDPSVIQAAAFGIGICAQLGGEMFKNDARFAIDKLLEVIGNPQAREDESFSAATDNAVSAIGKICLHHADMVDLPYLLSVWLGNLPLQQDTDELSNVYKTLCGFLERSPSSELLLDGDLGKLTTILLLLADAMESEGESSEELIAETKKAWKRIHSYLPPHAVMAAAQSLSEARRNILFRSL